MPKRIISNQKDRSHYSSKLPIPLRKILKESTGEIEVSEVQSKRLFDLCAKFTQTNLKLPGVTSSRARNPEYLKFEAKSIQNSRVLSPRYNIGNFDIKNKITKKIKVDETLFDLEESDDSKTNDINNFSRILNKEVCQMNYKAINELMKSKVLNTKICRRQLFTFNSLKMRLKSPKIKRESLL